MVGCTSWLSLQGEAGSLPIPGQGTPRDTLSLVLVKGSHNFHCLRRSVHVHAKADDCRKVLCRAWSMSMSVSGAHDRARYQSSSKDPPAARPLRARRTK